MNETMKEYIKITRVVMIILLVVILICPARIWAQNIELTNYERDTLISAAKELMESTRYCGRFWPSASQNNGSFFAQ